MTFIIKGGYDILRKQILNISLKRTNVWANGLILTKNNMYLGSVSPINENELEIRNYDNMNVLLLNNKIIYEDNKLFEYKIELNTIKEPDMSDPHIYNFIKYRYVDTMR
jgi:hypothetical protein